MIALCNLTLELEIASLWQNCSCGCEKRVWLLGREKSPEWTKQRKKVHHHSLLYQLLLEDNVHLRSRLTLLGETRIAATEDYSTIRAVVYHQIFVRQHQYLKADQHHHTMYPHQRIKGSKLPEAFSPCQGRDHGPTPWIQKIAHSLRARWEERRL